MKKILTLGLLFNSLLLANESIPIIEPHIIMEEQPIILEELPILMEEQPIIEEEQPIIEKINYLPYDEALRIAKIEQKMIMIKMTAEYCHYCKKMDIEVMEEPEIVEALKKDFVSVEIDVEMDEIPLELRKMMTPSFVFVTNNEDVVSIVPGSWTKEDFLGLLKSAKEEGEK